MTPRERVLAAIDLGHPDRVPLDFSANPATLRRLIRDLGVADHRALLDKLHVDCVDIRGLVDPAYRGPVPQERLRPDGVKEHLWGWRTRTMPTATRRERRLPKGLNPNRGTCRLLLRPHNRNCRCHPNRSAEIGRRAAEKAKLY